MQPDTVGNMAGIGGARWMWNETRASAVPGQGDRRHLLPLVFPFLTTTGDPPRGAHFPRPHSSCIVRGSRSLVSTRARLSAFPRKPPINFRFFLLPLCLLPRTAGRWS